MLKSILLVALSCIVLVAMGVVYHDDHVIAAQQTKIATLTKQVDSLTTSNTALSTSSNMWEANTYLYSLGLRLAEESISQGHPVTFKTLSRRLSNDRADSKFAICASLDDRSGALELWVDGEQHDPIAEVKCNLKFGSPAVQYIE